MADPLSTASSIIAVIHLSSTVVKYIITATGASKDRKKLREEVRACEAILQQINDDADDTEEGMVWSETVKALEELGAPLGRLFIVLQTVEEKLRSNGRDENIVTALKWPFQGERCGRDDCHHRAGKSLLTLALQNDSRKLIRAMNETSRESKRQLTELKDMVWRTSNEARQHFEALEHGVGRITELQDTKERETILAWLTTIDHAPQHNDYIRQRHPGTCQWRF